MSKDLALQQTEWDLHETPEVFIPLEFTGEIQPDLFGLETSKATEMTNGLLVTISERKALETAYIEVIDLTITTKTLPIFKELRLKIVKNRTQGIEKWHKTNKAFYLAGGRFVDAVKNKEVAINEAMELKLLDAEKFFENQQNQLKIEINKIRNERLAPYISDFANMDFSEMSDYDFDDYVLGKKTRFENETKEREAEALRIENERLAELERQRLLLEENAKLKADADAKELELKKERQENERKIIEERKKQEEIQCIADAKLKAEIDEKNKLEAKLKAIENERLANIESERINAEKLLKAPIKKQLSVWVDSFIISSAPIKNNTTDEILVKFESFKNWANSQIKNI